MKRADEIIVIGAGPAGLGSAYELSSHKVAATIIEKNDRPGGLARSHRFHQRFFDIGPHRFYTKNQSVLRLWKQILGRDFVSVNRLTRSLYNNQLFYYPVRLTDALTKLGLKESIESLVSFLQAKLLLRNQPAHTFEEWVTQRFGKKIYQIIFKTYTEKIWGTPCNRIGADWAEQRIKNISLFSVIKKSLGLEKKQQKSWVDQFFYPRQGAGQLYERLAALVQKNHSQILYRSRVTAINHQDNKITAVSFERSGKQYRQPVAYLFSSMPLTEFIFSLNPKPPRPILQAAKKLYYRDHISVNLLVDNPQMFPDNWIYVYSPELKMARIANYNNFRHHGSPPVNNTALTVEYFTFKTDRLWRLPDQALIKLAVAELTKTGIWGKIKLIDAFVVRESDAYPVYFIGYQKYFQVVKQYVSRFSNLQLIGRGGMYKYNNMDHAIYSGMLAARNYLLGKNSYDVWQINKEAKYLEK